MDDWRGKALVVASIEVVDQGGGAHARLGTLDLSGSFAWPHGAVEVVRLDCVRLEVRVVDSLNDCLHVCEVLSRHSVRDVDLGLFVFLDGRLESFCFCEDARLGDLNFSGFFWLLRLDILFEALVVSRGAIKWA